MTTSSHSNLEQTATRPQPEIATGIAVALLISVMLWFLLTLGWWRLFIYPHLPMSGWIRGVWVSLRLLINGHPFWGAAGWCALLVTPLSLTAGAALGWIAGQPAAAVRHIKGRKLIEDPAQGAKLAAAEARREIKQSAPGLSLHPSIPMSTDRETRGLMVFGAIGAGKTVVIKHLIQQVLDAGDRAIILDSAKGDFSSALVGLPGVGLLAPWDTRSLGWHVSYDYQSRSDARGLAAAIIPSSDGANKIWSDGARQILAGLIRECQVQQPRAWTFKDVIAQIEVLGETKEIRPGVRINTGYPKFRETVLKHIPEAALILTPELTRTVASFLSNVGASLSTVVDLADAWSEEGHGGPVRALSIERWVRGQYKRAPSTLVMQMSAKYRLVGQAYVQAVMTALIRLVGDPSLEDSKTRKIWLILDEFPQAGFIEGFETLIEIGRSKGIRVVIAGQDVSQYERAYGKEIVQSWTTMIGTTIITRSGGDTTPRFFSRLVGDREVERYTRQVNATPGMFGASGNVSHGSGYQHQAGVPVVSPEEFSTLLGVQPYRGTPGVMAFLHTGGHFVYRLHYSFTNALPARVDSVVPAPWTSPQWPSSSALSAALAAVAETATDGTPDAPPPAPAATAPDPLKQPAQQRPTLVLRPEAEAEEVDEFLPTSPSTQEADENENQEAAESETETDADQDHAQDENENPVDEMATQQFENVAQDVAAHAIDQVLPGAGMVMQLTDMVEAFDKVDPHMAGAPVGPVLLAPQEQDELDQSDEEEEEGL